MNKKQKNYIQKVTLALKMASKSDKTISSYTYSISRFINFFPDNTDFSSFTEDDIINYFLCTYLKDDFSSNTYNTNLYAIKFFFEVCFGIVFNNKLLPHSKVTKRLPTTISRDTFNMLFENESDIKHKCWLLLGYRSGLRVSEIATLKIENIFPYEHQLKILGKGKKERFTFLPDITTDFLRQYCKYKFIRKKSGFLFSGNQNNDHVSSDSISNYFTHLKKKYNLDNNLTFHSLRHSFATNFIRNGGDPFVLKSMMGHANLNTTSIYIHLAQNFNNLAGVEYD